MRAQATFKALNFAPSNLTPNPSITTALPVGVSTMEKTYEGQAFGRSATLFTAAFNPSTGIGAYMAMESFEGALNGRKGAFNFMHSAATEGTNRTDEFFAIVAGSGLGDLTGIIGGGGIRIDPDGTHNIWFDYQLEA